MMSQRLRSTVVLNQHKQERLKIASSKPLANDRLGDLRGISFLLEMTGHRAQRKRYCGAA